uniref:Uncharacterized protein n=1 Tax=Avena sativa TaxID=4498 RepID=A0ACD5YPV6_AVESA
MSTIYMSQLTTLPLMEGDQDQGHFQSFHLAKDPPILFPFMIDSPLESQGQGYGDQHLRQQFVGESNQQFSDHMMMAGGSSDDVFAAPSSYRPTIQSIGSDMIQRSSYNPYDLESKHAVHGPTSEWASGRPPVKMRIIRKASSTNDPEGGAARKPRRRAQHQADEGQLQQHAMGVIRVCSDCNTTKTPLWRSGPRGPKSLCNACGIRQRKARRAMAAAAAAAAVAHTGGATMAASGGGMAMGGAQAGDTSQAAKPTKKEKRALDVDRSLPFKKRCKMVDRPAVTATKEVDCIDAASKKDDDHILAEDVAAAETLSTPPAVIRGFTRDEITDAAMLLMNLSSGLVMS